MALRILESSDAGVRGTFRVPFNVAQTPVAVGASSAQSAAFAGGSSIVALQSDEDCHVAFGANPTATTSHFKLVAGQTWPFEVTPGHKVAVIEA